jgi:hypothetical protein
VTWTNIIADFPFYINAGWGKNGLEILIPWPGFQYSPEQLYEPLPMQGI